MRLLRILFSIVFIALGIGLGALNPQGVVLDLGVSTLRASLGVALLSAVLFGAVLGGLALSLGVIAPLRRALDRRRAPEQAPPPPYDTGV